MKGKTPYQILEDITSEEEMELQDLRQTNRMVALEFAIRKAENAPENFIDITTEEIITDAKDFYKFLMDE